MKNMSKMAVLIIGASMMSGCGTIYGLRNSNAQMTEMYLKNAKELKVTQATPVTAEDGSVVYDTHILATFSNGDWMCIHNPEGKHGIEEYENNPELIKKANRLKVRENFLVDPTITETLEVCKEHKKK